MPWNFSTPIIFSNHLFSSFWCRHPALLYGLAALLGSAAALTGYPILLVPILVLFLPLVSQTPRLLLAIALLVSVYMYASTLYRLPARPIQGIEKIAEWRHRAKHALAQNITDRIGNPHAASFLVGLAVGDFNDARMASALGRFGLQHIMAISGFHFGIVTSIIGIVGSALFTRRVGISLLLLLLAFYFVFLGPGPSVTRAWMMVTIGLVGQLWARRSNGLNSLGIALLAMVALSPAVVLSIGFQLSFLATAGILLFVEPIEKGLQNILPKRSLGEVAEFSLFDQHGAVVLGLFRKAFALGLAVNIAVIPLTLLLFQKFPLMSLLYNLFFPFLVSGCMLLLIAALCVQLIFPPLADIVYRINDVYTSWLLDSAFNMPQALDFTLLLQQDSITANHVVLYLTGLGVIGILVRTRTQEIETG